MANRTGLPRDGISANATSRRVGDWQVVTSILVALCVLAVLDSGGLVHWVDERYDRFDTPLANWIEPSIRHFDTVLRQSGLGRIHPAIRAWIRKVEEVRFGPG